MSLVCGEVEWLEALLESSHGVLLLLRGLAAVLPVGELRALQELCDELAQELQWQAHTSLNSVQKTRHLICTQLDHKEFRTARTAKLTRDINTILWIID